MISQANKCAGCHHPMYYHNHQFYCCNRNERYCILCRGKNCTRCNSQVDKVYETPKCKLCYSRSQPEYIFQPTCEANYCPKCLITRLPPLFCSPFTQSPPQLVLPCSHPIKTQKLVQFYKGKYCIICARKYSSLSDCDLVDGNRCCFQCFKYEKKKVGELVMVCVGCEREIKKNGELGVREDGLLLCFGCAKGGCEEQRRHQVQMQVKKLELSRRTDTTMKSNQQQGNKGVDKKQVNNYVDNSSKPNVAKQNQQKKEPGESKPLRPQQYQQFYQKNSTIVKPDQGYSIKILPSPNSQTTSQSQYHNTQSQYHKTQSQYHNTQPQYQNTQPQYQNTQPQYQNTQPPSKQQGYASYNQTQAVVVDEKQKSLSSTQSKSQKQSHSKSREKRRETAANTSNSQTNNNTNNNTNNSSSNKGEKDSLFKTFETKQNKLTNIGQFKQVESVIGIQVATSSTTLPSPSSSSSSQHSQVPQSLGRTILQSFPSQKQEPSPLPKRTMKRHFSIQTYVQKLKLQLRQSTNAAQVATCKQCQYDLNREDSFTVQDNMRNVNVYCRLCYTMLTNKQVFGFTGLGVLPNREILDKSRNVRGMSNQKYKEHMNLLTSSPAPNKNPIDTSNPINKYLSPTQTTGTLKKSDILDNYAAYTTKQTYTNNPSTTTYSAYSPSLSTTNSITNPKPSYQKFSANVRVSEHKPISKESCVACKKEGIPVIRTSRGSICFQCHRNNR